MPDACFEQLGVSDICSRKVLLNLAKCHFLDSSGVAWLLRIHQWFGERGGMLIIHSASPVVLQILNIMRMGLVLNLAANEEQRGAWPARCGMSIDFEEVDPPESLEGAQLERFSPELAMALLVDHAVRIGASDLFLTSGESEVRVAVRSSAS